MLQSPVDLSRPKGCDLLGRLARMLASVQSNSHIDPSELQELLDDAYNQLKTAQGEPLSSHNALVECLSKPSYLAYNTPPPSGLFETPRHQIKGYPMMDIDDLDIMSPIDCDL